MFEDFDLDLKSDSIAKIKIIGVGGGGNNAVNRMINDGVTGLEFIVANTDKQVLNSSPAPVKITLGEENTRGLGAGSDPVVGERAAIESEESIRQALHGADLVFVAAGMGGGTGTGAAPVIAKIAKEAGALVIGIVTTPFNFEGTDRQVKAKAGLEALYSQVDSIIIVSNDRLLLELGGVPIKDSFKYADAVLKQGVRTITDLIATPALINLDFADVKTVLKDQGPALIGIGNANGEDRAVRAAIEAINSPILEASIRGAKNAIINVTGGSDVSINDAHAVVQAIKDAAGREINVIFGIMINEKLGDEIVVSVIASGLDSYSGDISEDIKENNIETENYTSAASKTLEFDTVSETVERDRNSLNNSRHNNPSFNSYATQEGISSNNVRYGNSNPSDINDTDDDLPFFLRNIK